MTPELPGIPPKPKQKRQNRLKRAHMIDAGVGMPGFPFGARFQCDRCNWESEWICHETETEIRKGQPCPSCNDLEMGDR